MPSHKEVVVAADANPPLPFYSQAIKSNGHIFLSGNIGCTPDVKLVEGGVQGQTRAALENIKKILTAAGATMNDVVKVNIYLTDLKKDFTPMNEVYITFFEKGNMPARTCIGVATLPVDAEVEIECIAAIPSA